MSKEILLSKVTVNQEGCWIHSGGQNASGYAGVWYQGKWQRAHRVFYTVYVGPIPPGLMVCHTCDVRNCVNPLHLFVDTAKGNTKDMMNKGRNAFGTSAKITREIAEELRTLYKEGMTYTQLSVKYGLNANHVGKIIRGLRWK